jgi:dienelactone hydrolase
MAQKLSESHIESAPAISNAAPASRRTRAARARIVLARSVLALLFVVGAVTSLVPGGRAFARGALVLWPVLTASQPAPYVAVTEGVRHTQLTINSSSGPVYLDVYEPATPLPPVPGARGGLLFIPGVGDNRTDHQLVNLSESLARSGEVIMEMTTPTLISYSISPADSDAVVRAFERLARWPGVGAQRVGVVGFSGGGPLAVLAAVDPRIRDQVAFIVSFGGYYNVANVLRDFGRRALVVDGHTQPWKPTAVPLEVLANVLAARLPEPDATELQDAFAFDTPTPLTPTEVSQLTPEGQAAYHLLAGDQASKVDADIATLEPAAGDLLNALSPSSVVGQIRAPVYLLHDRGDTSLPYTEARAFAGELARLHHPYDYVEMTIFDHTQVRTGLPLGEVIVNGSHLSKLLYDILRVGS